MNENTRLIHEAIRLGAADAGFVKRGTAWYASRPESVLRLAPQKSQFGQQFYLNLGVYFRAFGENSTPSEVQSQLRARLEDTAKDPTEEKVYSGLLDFESSCKDRQALLTEVIRSRVVPFLDSVASLEGVKRRSVDPKFGRAALTRVLIERLGLEC